MNTYFDNVKKVTVEILQEDIYNDKKNNVCRVRILDYPFQPVCLQHKKYLKPL